MDEKFCDIYKKELEKKIPSKITNEIIDNLLKYDNLFMDWGFCWCDLSKCDLSDLDLYHLSFLTYNTSTVWPSKNRMPKDFNPKQILQERMDPMLGIKDLHKQGITGKGVLIAVIDTMPQNPDHVEIKDSNIKYIDFRILKLK